MEEKLTKQDFEDGKLLRYFKHVFLTEQTRRALMPVLGALRDTEVIVPVQISVSDADAEKILQLKKGETFDVKDQFKFKPDLLQNDEGTFFPAFSNAEQMPPEYAENFSPMKISAVQCIRMASQIKNINGIVLDAFTEAMLIPMESALLILKMKSRLEESE